MELHCRNKTLHLDSPKIMGIINATPDSFSDGGKYKSIDDVLFEVDDMLRFGADIIDIGGESTRPGYVSIPSDEEIDRISSVVNAITSRFDTVVSVDTYKYDVAKFALESGVHIINDVTGLHAYPDIAKLVAQYNAGIILTFNNIYANKYSKSDIINTAKHYINDSVDMVLKNHVSASSIVIDPGIGFGTTREQDMELIRNARSLYGIGCYPLLAGLSRKRIIGHLLDRDTDPGDRDCGTAGACIACLLLEFNILRVHNVRCVTDAINAFRGIYKC